MLQRGRVAGTFRLKHLPKQGIADPGQWRASDARDDADQGSLSRCSDLWMRNGPLQGVDPAD